jgi:hypothetical protein
MARKVQSGHGTFINILIKDDRGVIAKDLIEETINKLIQWYK